VISFKAINVETVIGRDILEQTDLSINQDEVTVYRKLAIDFLAYINISEESQADIDTIPNAKIKKE